MKFCPHEEVTQGTVGSGCDEQISDVRGALLLSNAACHLLQPS